MIGADQTTSQTIRISAQSNLRFLPLLYFFPKDMYCANPVLRKLPRKIREILSCEHMRTHIESDAFSIALMDAVASLTFPHFGFRGWKEDYTGYFPVWKLSYAMSLWLKALDDLLGMNLQSIINLPSYQSYPFLADDFIDRAMCLIVRKVIQEQGWQPMLDLIREMPCSEDFEPRNTNVRKDFVRKWYHTRSKKVKMISLESLQEDETGLHHEIADPTHPIESQWMSQDYCQRFMDTLSEKNKQILALRVKNQTYDQIAQQLGYQNHSGVLKRMKAIAKQWITYEQQTQQNHA